MTFQEIFTQEDANRNRIILHHEGMFYRAYNASAYLCWRYVHQFKLSCRLAKNENRWLVSLGFPVESAKKWLHSWPLEQLDGKTCVVKMTEEVDETDYAAWEDQARSLAAAADKFTPHTSVITGQRVYKTAYEVLLDTMRISVNCPRAFVDPLAVKAKCLSYGIAYSVSTLYEAPDRNARVDAIMDDCREYGFILQTLCDLKAISKNAFAMLCEKSESVRDQVSRLRPKVTAEVDGE